MKNPKRDFPCIYVSDGIVCHSFWYDIDRFRKFHRYEWATFLVVI